MAYQGPLPSPGLVLKFSLNWTEAGALHYSSHFYVSYLGGPVTQSDMNTLATAAATSFGTNMKSMFASDIVLNSVTVQDLSTNTGLVATSSPGTAGNASGTTVEAGTAIRLRFKIAAHYRGGHPGIYLPPSTTANVSEPSSWSGAFQTQAATSWTAFMGPITGASVTSINTLTQCAVSYYKGPYPNPDPSQWAEKNVPKYRATPVVLPVTSVSTMPIIASQRRRRQATGA